MQHQFAIPTVVFCALLLTGCSSLKAPQRPDYTGADNVTTAMATQLIGTWIVSDLNPYPGNESQTTTIEYRDDGTVRGTMIPGDKGMEAFGKMEFELTGNWILNGDIVSHENVTMSSTSDNAMADLVSNIINSRPAITSTANIYELSDSRMILVGSDGNAMEYLRQ